ncbi:MAG: FecCD family ABC transporter permease [Oscillospiraceae bacterium]
MKNNNKIILSILISIFIILLGIGVGSVFIEPFDILKVFLNKLFSIPLSEDFDKITIGLVWSIRTPRVLLSFIVGAALAVSGSVVQSVLQNPLASTYGLGVSAGAGLGAAVVMIFGLSSGVFSYFITPLISLIFGLFTVFLSITFSYKIDKNLSNNTIVLTGMVISLFINAVLSTISAMNSKYTQRIMLWQLGSFSMKDWEGFFILLPIIIIGIFILLRYLSELDIMTFGQEDAISLGVDIKKTKWILIFIAATMTGVSVSFVGIIGFVDLITPHVVRRFFGSNHKYVIPLSVIYGGSFMVLCDLIARTIASPKEVPIGSVTALIGAPFFIYIYLRNSKR